MTMVDIFNVIFNVISYDFSFFGFNYKLYYLFIISIVLYLIRLIVYGTGSFKSSKVNGKYNRQAFQNSKDDKRGMIDG